MPRRQYVADLHKAQNDVLPHGIHDLQQGEDDGQFEFLFAASGQGHVEAVKVTALIPDLGDYPRSHEYMVFAGEEAPLYVSDALSNVRKTSGKTVYELLDIVSATLARLSSDQDADGDTDMPDSQLELDGSDEDDNDVYGSDDDSFITGADKVQTTFAQPPSGTKLQTADRHFRARIRADLIKAKSAGFKVGVLGHVLDGFNAFVTISIRISKLGISEEAMEAWQVDAKDFLILIIQYPNGYKTNEELQSFDSLRLSPNLGMRIVAGKKYKPTLQEAIKAFTVAKKAGRDSLNPSDIPSSQDVVQEGSIRETFISKPLIGLLQDRLVPIVRFRSAGMGWEGAESMYQLQASAGANPSDAVPDSYYQPEEVNRAIPDMVNADHYATRGIHEYSFPLLAMQFLLRHFVRCTEFCLVCHRKMETQLEAIKPYVCDSELCLYQYMTLGFGPSIEHEIIAQPYVVDLLVSFCYNSAVAKKLKEYPDGLSLTVPPVQVLTTPVSNDPYGVYSVNVVGPQPAKSAEKSTLAEPEKFTVGFDGDRLEVIFFDKPDVCPVRRGDWIVMKLTGQIDGTELHCRIAETTYFPTISVNEPVWVLPSSSGVTQGANATAKGNQNATHRPVTPAATPKWVPATFNIYNQDFKSLNQNEKCMAICKLLDTLPTVKEMQEYLVKRHPADLKNWVDRLSPAVVSLLRWIIASNRACIMQVDGDSDGASTPTKKQERLYGMKDYMQFRFAMGAPDKEQRFITEMRRTTDRLKLDHPTIFAWHGSPLYNWHMIIREGLHYKNTDHGRAYGHGVYHALDAGTSTGYSGMYRGGSPNAWPSSVLRIGSALALNEIVNAPAEFVSQSPFYVVQHLDWIQTRYLFVQCAPTVDGLQYRTECRPEKAFQQDPKRIPKGTAGPIEIPSSAVKSHKAKKKDRKPAAPKNPSPLKKLKALGGSRTPMPIGGKDLEDDEDSSDVETDPEDLEVLFGSDPQPEPETPAAQVATKPKGPTTDFVPGSLDFESLPLMPLPEYATSGTTKRLMSELKSLAKVQTSVNVAELGWFIDIERIDNVYQWIVELHSFHTFDVKNKPLPLADEMEKKKITSVVLEVRFNKDFPYTPPYVRVIRPRFLSLAQGGGGHIVLGGAMCMELLTNTGWSSVSSMESVLMQIRMAIASEPFARLDMQGRGDYGTGEAAEGYVRACQTHGWQVPPGFREMAYGIGSCGNAGAGASM